MPKQTLWLPMQTRFKCPVHRTKRHDLYRRESTTYTYVSLWQLDGKGKPENILRKRSATTIRFRPNPVDALNDVQDASK